MSLSSGDLFKIGKIDAFFCNSKKGDAIFFMNKKLWEGGQK